LKFGVFEHANCLIEEKYEECFSVADCAESEISPRIYRRAVDPYFIMYVRSCAAAAYSYISNYIPTMYLLAGLRVEV
jgi:hypothetical protein